MPRTIAKLGEPIPVIVGYGLTSLGGHGARERRGEVGQRVDLELAIDVGELYLDGLGGRRAAGVSPAGA